MSSSLSAQSPILNDVSLLVHLSTTVQSVCHAMPGEFGYKPTCVRLSFLMHIIFFIIHYIYMGSFTWNKHDWLTDWLNGRQVTSIRKVQKAQFIVIQV